MDELARFRQALAGAREQAASLAAQLGETEARLAAGEDEIAGLKQRLAEDADGGPGRVLRNWSGRWRRRRTMSPRSRPGSTIWRPTRLARQQRIAALREALAAAEAKAVTLAGRLEEAEAGRAAGRDEIRRLEATVVEGEEEARTEIAALKQALAEARAQAAARARLLESAEAERDAQIAEAARLREEFAAAEAKAAALAERLAAAAHERDTQRNETARLEAALAEAAGKRAAEQRAGESRLKEALAEVARLRDELALARNRLAEAREDLQLRRGVTETRPAGEQPVTPDTVERALFEAAEARVMQLAVENTRLRDQLADLDAIERGNEDRIAALRQQIDDQIAEIEKLDALRRALAEAQRRLEAEKAEQVDRLAYLRTRAEKAEAESRLAKAQVARLAANIQALKEQVKRLNEALEASEAKAEAAETLVIDARLNSALVRKIDELRRFRSEFVGQLREALAGQQVVRTEDDRFYLPAEVLFLSGSADLDRQGKDRVRRIGRALTDVAARIPEDLDWVLRVDGHTDRQRLRDRSRYKTNWELSVARAVAVVRLLQEAGVPAERLAATGFGEFHPLDPADTREAYRRNRRIEFSLTRK